MLRFNLHATRLFAALLYDVSATDPTTFLVVPMALVVVAAVAAWVPARRALRVEPSQALAAE